MSRSVQSARPALWLDKPYYSLHAYCRHTFDEKLYKIALNAGMTCPNRDGLLDTRGCIFCSAGGSGEFAVSTEGRSIAQQIRCGIDLFQGKRTGTRFIAYFQAFTNTYAPVSRLRMLFTQALEAPQIAGISIATRPDCLPEEVLTLLTDLRQTFPGKFIWLELGLQTVHPQTAAYIRRGYPLSCFTDAVHRLHLRRLPVIVHTILGLPGENRQHIYETICFLNTLPVFGVKLQLLHVLEGTDLAADYRAGMFRLPDQECYTDLVIGALERLSPNIVVHRITGDGPKDLLIAPKWSLHKRNVLNRIHQEMRRRDTWQGKYTPTDRSVPEGRKGTV